MAIIFIDGFGHYRSAFAGDYLDKWTYMHQDLQTITANELRPGARCVNMDANHYSMYKDISSETYLYVGMSLYVSSSSDQCWWAFYNASGVQVTFTHEKATGVINARRGNNSGTILDSTAAGAIQVDTWYYVEFKVRVHDTLGEVEFKINGVATDLVASALDTQNSGSSNDITRFFIDGYMKLTDVYFDDSQFNGIKRVDTLFPDEDGNYTQFTPSAGNNFECVDDPTEIDGDSTYVEGDALNEKDTYTLDNLSVVSGAGIDAIAITTCDRKDGSANTLKVKPVLRINSTDYYGVEEEPQSAYKIRQEIFLLNPDDAAAWEDADINGMEAGMEITTLA